ncbi:MAG: pyridoxal phosphate enzyme YggS [Planctomycetota bacterium]|nr:MAG: pyridoxal phosphate enzyme YggS [Planctomycetota bacterium]
MEAAERVAANVAGVRERIATAAKRAGRDPREITLVAITKSQGRAIFPLLAAAGVQDVGENRALEAIEKSAGAPPGLRWHLAGHLQTNKVRKALGLFRIIHSVDSLRLARAINAEAPRGLPVGRPRDGMIDAFVEINSGEQQKSGLASIQLPAFLEEARTLACIRWIGLMTMAPYSDDPESARPHFRRLRELRDASVMRGFKTLKGLSMGMTGDFEVAVEEGATHVRIGRALFEGLR